MRDVAHHVGKSESAVKQQFATYRKNGLMHFYNGMKIREARKLIREGRYNMTQIAEMLQFENPQYFSKCFRRAFGYSPSKVRGDR